MPQAAHPAPQSRPPFQGFGPIGSILVIFAATLGTFCLSLTVSIFAMLAWNTLGHHQADYALTYRYIATPAGLAAGFGTTLALAALALQRRLRRSS